MKSKIWNLWKLLIKTDFLKSHLKSLKSNIFQACDVPCDAQCRGGCNKAFDSRACLECQNDKLFYTNTKFDCIEACDALYTDVGGMPTWTTDVLLGTTIQTGNIHDNNGQNFGAGNITKAYIALEYTSALIF